MRVATWNVNSIKARLERVSRWLERRKPDIVCLQELKAGESSFPYEHLQSLGYHCCVFGQKTYNGVAVLSRTPPAQVQKGLSDNEGDSQARFIAASIGSSRVISIYVPNGGTTESDKFLYKLTWLDRFRQYLEKAHTADEPLLVCGDTNVALSDADVAHPDQWSGSVLCVPAVRDRLQRICDWGLIDLFARRHPEGGAFSWWDYRQLAFPKNNGLRIDHILATQPLAERCREIIIDREERKGKKPSDHAPVIADFE